MGCGSYAVAQVMVGLHRVGVVGLRQALVAVDELALAECDAILDALMALLGDDNYIPERQVEAFRVALWREYLRHRGEDFSAFFSEVEVMVRGEPGEERDLFVETVVSIFGEFELRPVFTFAPAVTGEANPQLAIGDDAIVRGFPSRRAFKAAVRASFSDW